MDNLAARLEAAADELAGMKADLAGHEFEFDRAGKGATEVAALLQQAWQNHSDLTSRLAQSLTGLSVSVRVSAGNYRATDREAM